MKTLLTLTLMMVMMMMAASQSTNEPGLFGCRDDREFKVNVRKLYDWQLALDQCTKPRTLEFCESQLDNCTQVLSKLHGEMDNQTYAVFPRILFECSEVLKLGISYEGFPATLAELQSKCLSLDEADALGLTLRTRYLQYRCAAYRLDWDQMDSFQKCINGLEY